MRKARDRRHIDRAEISAIVPVAHGRVQKANKVDALLLKEISEGVYEILSLEHTNDSIGKLVDVMCQN